MNAHVLRGQEPHEALIGYYGLIADQTPINLGSLMLAAEYDAFLGSEAVPQPTQALLDTAWEIKSITPDYSAADAGSLPAPHVDRERRGMYLRRFDSIRTDIVLNTLVELVQTDVVAEEKIPEVTQAAVGTLQIIESPHTKQLSNQRRKDLRRSFEPLTRISNPETRLRAGLLMRSLPETRGGRFGRTLTAMFDVTGRRHAAR